jgi:hypothetical protein
MVYSGCSVPSPSYIGNFRGDASHSELVDYDVIVGDRPGVPAEDVDAAVAAFFESAADALAKLDRHFPPGAVPTTAEDVKEIVIVAAVIHGEWVRIHPFANGNGRTARLLANYVALRYGLPAFVRLKPRPDGVQHAHASKTSMDRPQDIVGDHGATYFVFLHMLRSTLEDGSS